jgi:putative chitinase
MFLPTLRRLVNRASRPFKHASRQGGSQSLAGFKPRLEALEDRTLPTGISVGPGTGLPNATLDTSGGRTNVDLTDPVSLAAGMYTAIAFHYDSGRSGDVRPFLAVSNGLHSYSVLAVGAQQNPGASLNQTVAFGGSGTFTLPAATTVYAGLASVSTNPIFFRGDAGLTDHNNANLQSVFVGATLNQFNTPDSAREYAFSIDVMPVASAAVLFSVSAPASVTPGSPFLITVTALDASNHTATGYTGTVQFTSSDPYAVLPGDPVSHNYTFTPADQGVGTFAGVTLVTAGSQTVTATDTATSSITGTASVAVNAGAGVTLVQLQQIMPNLPLADALRYLTPLNSAMAEFQINTPERVSAFLAQLAVESHELSRWNELYTLRPDYHLPGSPRPAHTATDQEDYFNYWYGNRPNLGNTQPGDGYRFRGRGPIQLTGRDNYAAAGTALGLDLLGNPDLVSDYLLHPEVGFRVAAWFWQSHGLNEIADTVDTSDVLSTWLVNTQITHIVNGGYNDLSSRYQYYLRALNILTS